MAMSAFEFYFLSNKHVQYMLERNSEQHSPWNVWQFCKKKLRDIPRWNGKSKCMVLRAIQRFTFVLSMPINFLTCSLFHTLIYIYTKSVQSFCSKNQIQNIHFGLYISVNLSVTTWRFILWRASDEKRFQHVKRCCTVLKYRTISNGLGKTI